jgi:hypothetical protein
VSEDSSLAIVAGYTGKIAGSAGTMTAAAGSRAGSSSGDVGASRCRPAAIPASSFWTRRPPSPPGTARAECRHEDYRSFLNQADATSADELDRRLHAERIGGDVLGRRLHETQAEELPDGAFVLLGGAAYLVLGDAYPQWTPGGYAEQRRRPRGRVEVVTPPTSLRVLGSGWTGSLPLLPPSSRS